MTVDEQIAYLNDTVKTRLGPSAIHGVGVFAICDILSNERLFDMGAAICTVPANRFGDIRPEILALILDRYPNAGQAGRTFRSPNGDAVMMSFLNHSDTPNSSFGRATRLIIAGEEITEDYNDLGGELSKESREHYSSFLKS